MALNLGALPYFMQYEQQAQQQQQARQEAQMRMAAFQQQQQDRQRQQAAMQAAGQALPGLLAAPPQPMQPQPGSFPGTGPTPQSQFQPPPQPPQPGQASQPMAQPGQAPQGQQPGAPLPPFRPMPSSPPPQSAAPQGNPPPPQAAPAAPQLPQAGLTLSGAIDALRSQGLEGADLMAGLGQLMPVLDAQSKAQAAQIQSNFNNEMKLAALQDRRDALKEKHDEALQRAEDKRLDRADRAAARAESNAIRREMLAIKVQQAAGNPDAKLDKETLQYMAQQYVAAPDQSMFTNLGRGAQGAGNVIALRRAIQEEAKAQGLSPAEMAAKGIAVGGEKAAARTAGTKATNVELAASEAQKTMGIAQGLSNQLPRTQFVPANRAIQAWQTNTGDPKVIAFGAALNTVVNAYARAISPSGTPTVSDKEHARQMLSTANTKEQFDSVMNVMQQEMAAARQAPREVMESQRGRITGAPVHGAAPAAAPAIPAGWSVKER